MHGPAPCHRVARTARHAAAAAALAAQQEAVADGAQVPQHALVGAVVAAARRRLRHGHQPGYVGVGVEEVQGLAHHLVGRGQGVGGVLLHVVIVVVLLLHGCQAGDLLAQQGQDAEVLGVLVFAENFWK